MAQSEQKNEYRSERKERLAKEAKKKNKKSADSTKVVSGVIIALLIVGVLAAIGGSLYAYGVPQRLLPAVKVSDRTYSVAEYGFYYTNVYQSYATQANEYQSQLGFAFGFDPKKDPEAQTTKDEDGNDITYADLFKKSVIETLESYNYYLNLIEQEKVELNEDSKKEIEETISQLGQYAQTNKNSLNRYVSFLYGKGVNEKLFRSLLEEQYLVAQYIEAEKEKSDAEITKEAIEEEYNKNGDNYKAVDLRLFGLDVNGNPVSTDAKAPTSETKSEEETSAKATDETTTEGTTAAQNNDPTQATEAESTTEGKKEPSKQEVLANEMLSRITDEASFVELAKEYCAEADKEKFEDDTATLATGITKSVVETNIDKDLAEWLFNAERKVGDKTVITTDKYVYVIYVKNTAYRNEEPLVSARHILISYDNIKAALEQSGEVVDTTTLPEEVDTSNTKYDAKVILATYNRAKEVYEEYKKGAQTEEAFTALAEKYSADTASIGENGTGGLYENIEKGKMVAPFENWVYDSARKTGDTGIVQTSYGYHIMYFVDKHEEAPWVEAIRSELSAQKDKAIEDKVKEATKGTAVPDKFVNFAVKEALALINKLYIPSANAQ